MALEVTMQFYVWPLPVTLMAALLLMVATTGAVKAGPLQDGEAAYQRGDYATALQFFRPLAELGDAFTQDDPGVMYDKGLGVPQDYAAAVRWYRIAAEQGDAGGRANLGIMYAAGHGVPQNYAEAVSRFASLRTRATR